MRDMNPCMQNQEKAAAVDDLLAVHADIEDILESHDLDPEQEEQIREAHRLIGQTGVDIAGEAWRAIQDKE
jgi:hypothetical protein